MDQKVHVGTTNFEPVHRDLELLAGPGRHVDVDRKSGCSAKIELDPRRFLEDPVGRGIETGRLGLQALEPVVSKRAVLP